MASVEHSKFRFSLRGILLLFVICALLSVVFQQYWQADSLRSQIRRLESKLIPPATTAEAVSYVEVVNLKDNGTTYTNKVLIAADGRKRVEHLSSKRRLVSIFDDWGIQRLYMRPTAKTATKYEAVEEFGGGRDLKEWIHSFQVLAENSDNELGRSELYGRPVVGYSKISNGATFVIWADEATGKPRHIEIDSPQEKMILVDIQYHDKVDGSMFSFDAPEDYTVIERQLVNKEKD